jgi:hypothetical protein
MSKRFGSIEELRQANNWTPPEEILFMGRDEELQTIADFWKGEAKILVINGVAMIGKSMLTTEFCKQQSINTKRIVFSKEEKPQETLRQTLFAAAEPNDFSKIDTKTLIIIANFEYALHWLPTAQNLHKITAKGIHDFIDGSYQLLL